MTNLIPIMSTNDNSRNNPTSAVPAPSVYRTSIKVPPFWAEKPALWFVQLEGQFELNNITSDATKYFYVTSNLDSKYALEVEDILTAPPATNKYGILKAALTSRLSKSKEQKIKQLLEHEEMGDRTPSQFMRHLKNLAGTEVPEDFVRTLWIGRLPQNMQAILATQTSSDLKTVGVLADKIAEIAPATQISAASQVKSENVLINQLAQQINALAERVEELTREKRSRRSRSTSAKRDRERSASASKICWYHRRYKEKARRCTRPCEYTQEKNP